MSGRQPSDQDGQMQFAEVDPDATHYRRLMVDEHADDEIIRVVYRRLARRYHPDVDASPRAQRRMVELNEAYEVLRDPARRDAYDVALAAQRERRTAGGPHRGAAASQFGEAGPPTGAPSGSVLGFGRYRGWTLGQIARHDPDFLEWLMKMPIGGPYRVEIAALLRRSA